MKKSVAISIAVLLFMTIGTVQGHDHGTNKTKKALGKLEGKEVSVLAKSHFNEDFGNLPDVQWIRSANFDEASFTRNGIKMKAWYGDDARLIGTTSYVSFSDVPAKGQKEIKARYKDYTIGPVVFFEDNETNESDMILYGMQFEDADNYFVELSKGKDIIVLKVTPESNVSFFQKLSK
jgi:hypothetical protein